MEQKNKKYLTCGPTELFSIVRDYMIEALDKKLPSISHRSKDFEVIFQFTVSELKKLMEIPDDFMIFFSSSGTECMERIIENLVKESSYHFVNGSFSERFYKTAQELKKNPILHKVEFGEGFDFDNIDIPDNIELICITQNETSSGVAVPMKRISELKDKYPDKLIAIDVVTSAPYQKIDFAKVDVAFFSVQKGFGLPPGLGVTIIRKSCIEKTISLKEQNYNIGTFNNYIDAAGYFNKNQTTVTPNTLGIYLLGKVANHLNTIGKDKIRFETEEKARLLYDYFYTRKDMQLFVKNPFDRSKTIIVIDCFDKQNAVKKYLSDNGFIVSSGYGKYVSNQIRIANFPMHTVEDVTKLIELIDVKEFN
ncbi:MAG: aminotransferase class V-fold PLP-dependent enzyme [Bacteroidetes bacterium]|nr:aminotransferase class V-fold PLP-dependent enzyme [Bacteroidota bacterium]